MAARIRIWLAVLAVLLALLLAVRYFDTPPPQICVDGRCYDIE